MAQQLNIAGDGAAGAPDPARLVRLGAVLRGFDRSVLAELAAPSDRELDAFLEAGLVETEAASARLVLKEPVRTATLDELRSEQPAAELLLHEQALRYYVLRLSQQPADDASESECLYHLGELFRLHAARDEWHALQAQVARVRDAGPRLVQHQHMLRFYDAWAAVNLQHTELAEQQFHALLAEPALDSALRCRTLNALAGLFFYQTNYDRALELYRRVVELATGTGNASYLAIAQLNMGMIYNELERYDLALDITSNSLDTFRRLRDRRCEAIALYEIGNSALRLGRWQLAAEHFDAAVKLMLRQNDRARLPAVYWGQGLLYHLLGDESASEAAYLAALRLVAEPNLANRSVESDVLWQLGFLYYTQGRHAESLERYSRAIELAEQLASTHWLSLLHYQRGNVLLQLGRAAETFAEYRRAIASIEALREASTSEEVKIGLLGTTQQVYEAMVQLCLEHGRERDAFAFVERARSRAFLDTLLAKAPELAPGVQQPLATLNDVQRTLPPGALLLEFYTAGVLPRGEHLVNRLPAHNGRLREHLVRPPAAWVFAISSDTFEVHALDLDPNTLRPLPNDPGPGRRLLLNARLIATLRDRLLGPVEHLLAGRDTVFIVPHGPLHYVPWAALPDGNGGFLVQPGAPALAMAPSATVLLHACLRPQRADAGGSLAIGYNDCGASALVTAEAEARAVARLLGGEVWSGSRPKGRRLLQLDQRLRRLHFAGHAVYRPDDPLGSELRLGDGDTLSAREIIAGLELDADLVTLSACTSGLSHVVPGDELLGLQRAFLYAGARAVLCTLWEASDTAAMLLMEQFYAALERGVPAAAALRDAQVALRELTGRELAATLRRWRDQDPEHAALFQDLLAPALAAPDARPLAEPFYWAPFMLIGKAG